MFFTIICWLIGIIIAVGISMLIDTGDEYVDFLLAFITGGIFGFLGVSIGLYLDDVV